MSESNDSRKCILEVAARLFAKLGIDKCSTREIAKESKANISLISYYFGGKEGLYKEVIRETALEMKEHVQARIQATKDLPMTREHFISEINMIVESLIYFRLKYPEVSQIFAREKLTGLEHSKEIHKEIFYPLTLQFFELIAKAQKAGVVKPTVNSALFFALLSEGIWGFFMLRDCPIPLAKEFEAISTDIEKLKQQISEIYLEGVLV